MTTLTKVFIVVLAIFAIAFSMLVVQYTAQTTNYRKLSDENRRWALQEQSAREAADTKHKVVIAHFTKVISRLQSQIAQDNANLAKANMELANVKNDLLAEQGKTASLMSQANQLTNMSNASGAERKQLQSQLLQVRKDNAALRTDNITLSKTNQKLGLQRQLYEKEIRLLKEQNFSLGERMEKLRGQLQTSASGVPASSSPDATVKPVSGMGSSPIIGEVTNVRDGLAEISVGGSHGVKSGMEFIVYRGSQYLGKLKINKVLADKSAGNLLQVQGNIRPGDKVTDKFQF